MSKPSYSIGNSTYVCQYPGEIISVSSRGVFLGDNPLLYSAPLIMLQMSIVSLITHATNFCLKPLGQSSVVSQILAGIILGPSVLGQSDVFTSHLFPRGSHSTLETIATFGVMFFLFQVGVKTDPGMIKQCGKKSIVIGVLVFLLPLAFATSMAFILKAFVTMDKSLSDALPMIAASQSLTGFIVIACHLTELKIINTDLGRLAVSSSMIGDVLGISLTAVSLALQQGRIDPLDAVLGIVTVIAMVGFIVYVVRPLALLMIKLTPVGEPVKEIHIFVLFVGILVFGFMSESIGQHFVLGPLVLGLALPDGPPLGAELVEKLDSLVSFVLFPVYLAVSGLKTDMFSIELKSSWILAVVVFFAFVVKVVAAMLPCLYTNMPWRESFVLGLTLNTKGIVELLLYNIWKDTGVLKEQEFSLTVLSVLFLTAIISPLMRILYDPSKRFVSSKKNTIQHAKRNAELRILVCVHKQENVPSIINILEISHPSVETPIGVVVLQLVKLVGRSAPMLMSHQPQHNFMIGSSRTQNVVNAFRQFEMQNQGLTSVEPYTAIAHLATMHDDICNLAIDKKVNFVITPFHKEWAIDGKIGSENRSIRTMNRNILEKAPCSVGIFVDRTILNGSLSVLASRSFYRVAVIFMGGIDDVEALAYGIRMVEHPQVNLTILRFLAFGCDNARNRKLDNDLIDEFRANTAYNRKIEYREEVVKDGEGLSAVIKDIGKIFDLVMVGRHHIKETRLLSGLTEWNECPELGIVGDMLASPDFKGMCSILVVQQARVKPGMRNRDPEFTVHTAPQEDTAVPRNDGTWRISVER
ncbi:hypothetical protein IFM89_036554 [Coptis chinensis]|uniref:Cation/H+ exchanger domain-containing protein n=1 Tax=Coptis chinensis TaxID=261450 RepID=A0A835HHR3_9MAGN|nr:hypothetical protein IFM89_036554 [Coptis chinensis]